MNKLEWLKRRVALLFFTSVILSGGCGKSIKKEASGNKEAVYFGVKNEIKRLIEENGKDSLLPEIASVKPEASLFIKRFYIKRKFKEAWSSHQKLTNNFLELELLINNAKYYGLDTTFYHLENIHALLNKVSSEIEVSKKNKMLADLDILSTNAYMLYATHLNKGVIDPFTYAPVFKGNLLSFDLVSHLEKALTKNKISESLINVQPTSRQYVMLQKALEKYLAINDLDERVYFVPACTRDSSSCYAKTKIALATQHYIDTLSVKDKVKLTSAIKNFQHYHGLQETGIPGVNTREALGTSTLANYEQIAMNLERWRWENPWAEKYIFVNIPAYRMQIIKKNEAQATYRVIVGAPKTPTPEITSRVKNIISNPYWNVPYSISTKEILPLVQKDPDYLASKNFKVYDRDENQVDPNGVNWESVSASNLSYSFRQDPGTFNSLGIIKFDFPNSHGVYMHDTPSHSLFNKEARCLSHGCIRLEDPLRLSTFLLNEEGRKEVAMMVDSFIQNGVHRTISLKCPVPIYIRYFSSEADKEGNVYYYKDIYKKDEQMKKSLFQR